MSKNNDYTSCNLLNYDYFLETNRKRFKQTTEVEEPDLKQQINFIGKLEDDNDATMFFIIEKSEKSTFSFSQNSVSII